MISNIILFIGGAFVGVMIMSCLTVASIEDAKQEEYFRGLKRGRHEGRIEERGRHRHD